MRVETNERLVQRNRRTAQILFYFSLAILIMGFIAVNAQLFITEANDVIFALSYVLPTLLLPFAFVTTILSVRMTNLWVREPRPEKVIPENLKSISGDSVFYSYYHFPARHVLICPQGVFAIVTRFHHGKIEVNGDKWEHKRRLLTRFFNLFRFDRLGNPSTDALAAAEAVQAKITPIAPGVQVQPLVVFIDPNVQLTVNNVTVPVVRAQTSRQPSFKDYLRDLKRKGTSATLTKEQIAAFEAATIKA